MIPASRMPRPNTRGRIVFTSGRSGAKSGLAHGAASAMSLAMVAARTDAGGSAPKDCSVPSLLPSRA